MTRELEDRFGNPQWRCPCCGRFIQYDADGFYDTAERGANPDTSHVACFCDEACADKFHGRAAQAVQL
jgi:hypothetical protein